MLDPILKAAPLLKQSGYHYRRATFGVRTDQVQISGALAKRVWSSLKVLFLHIMLSIPNTSALK